MRLRNRKTTAAKGGSPDASPEPVRPDSSSAGEGKPGGPAGKPVTLLVNAPDKWRKFWTRFLFTWLMIGTFLALVIYGRQTACTLLVFTIQAAMYTELVLLMRNYQREQAMPRFVRLYYWWFFVCIFFVYGRTLRPHLVPSLTRIMGMYCPLPCDILRRHALVSYSMYIIGLIAFIIGLKKKKHYRYQFAQFGFCHVTLMLIVAQSSSLVSNIFKGLIWFLVPTSLVVCNDIMAFMCGFFFGKTPLIHISPKKTVEGFVGATFFTVTMGMAFCRFVAQFKTMTCPQKGFGFEFQDCKPDRIYTQVPLQTLTDIPLPEFIGSLHSSAMEWHTFVLAIFASVVAPFGGFFASGFKRAFDIKDFGTLIPGHGGITDRFDCQILVGMFVFVYLSNFISPEEAAERQLVDIERLSVDDQTRVYHLLRQSLRTSGVLVE